MAKKPIFQEVEAPMAQTSARIGGMIDTQPRGARRWVLVWLVLIAALIAASLLAGGAARLLGTAPAVTPFVPLLGFTPPMNAEAWQDAYALFSSRDRFTLAQSAPDAEAFRSLYMLACAQRGFSVAAVAVFVLGLALLRLRRHVPPGWGGRLGLIGGAALLYAAVIVWASLPDSPVWPALVPLAMALGLATFGLALWSALLARRSAAETIAARRLGEPKLFAQATGLMHLAALVMVIGAALGSLEAGRMHMGWPGMAGTTLPAGLWVGELGLANLWLNPVLVQMAHRVLAYILVALALLAWWRARRSAHPRTRGAFDVALVAILGQAVIGVLALRQDMAAGLAIAHQIGALLSFATVLRARFFALYPQHLSLRGHKS